MLIIDRIKGVFLKASAGSLVSVSEKFSARKAFFSAVALALPYCSTFFVGACYSYDGQLSESSISFNEFRLHNSSVARARIMSTALSLVGVEELTGKNDGPKINEILASVGLEGAGAPWCAAANRYVYDLAGLRSVAPRSAWSPDWVARPTWTLARGGVTPLPGDAFGLFFPSKNRIAHTGLVRKWGAQSVLTFEGNTSPEAVAGSAADRDGQGYWSKRRLTRQIHSVRNWLD